MDGKGLSRIQKSGAPTPISQEYTQYSSGFTLMELMVYIAIMGIVVLVAGQAFSDSTKMRIRTQSMVKANEIAGNIATLIKDDIAQMGAKSSKEVSTTLSDSFYVSPTIYIAPTNNPPDSSSFVLEIEDDVTKSITFRKIRYNDQGRYQAVEEVAWIKDGSKLLRSCKTLALASGAAVTAECPTTGNTVEIADRVTGLKILPAKPGVVSADMGATGKATLLPSSDTSVHDFRLLPRFDGTNLYFAKTVPENGGESISISGFATNYDYENAEVKESDRKANQLYVANANSTNAQWTDCKRVSFAPNVEYEILFDIPYSENASRMFCQGRDHASVGFRTTDGNKVSAIDDFLFYPPISSTAPTIRAMRFSVKDSISNVCMAFTFASYSPLAGTGSIQISNLKLHQVPTANYEFIESFVHSTWDKQNVKAFRIDLTVAQNGEAGTISLVVPTPSNGPRD